MAPTGVVRGQKLEYSNSSPGASTGFSPTTPGPCTRWVVAVAVGDEPLAADELGGLVCRRSRSARGRRRSSSSPGESCAPRRRRSQPGPGSTRVVVSLIRLQSMSRDGLLSPGYNSLPGRRSGRLGRERSGHGLDDQPRKLDRAVDADGARDRAGHRPTSSSSPSSWASSRRRSSRRRGDWASPSPWVLRIGLLASLAWIARLTSPLFFGARQGDLGTRPDPARGRPLPAHQGDPRDPREAGGRGGRGHLAGAGPLRRRHRPDPAARHRLLSRLGDYGGRHGQSPLGDDRRGVSSPWA